MKKFKNHQRPRRKYRFNIIGHKKALKIWWDSPFKTEEQLIDTGLIKGSSICPYPTYNYTIGVARSKEIFVDRSPGHGIMFQVDYVGEVEPYS
jgi:hypothetical protein